MERSYPYQLAVSHVLDALNAGGMPRIVWALLRVGLDGRAIGAIARSRAQQVTHWRKGRQAISPPKLLHLRKAALDISGHLRNVAEARCSDDDLGEILFDLLDAEARLLRWVEEHPERTAPEAVL